MPSSAYTGTRRSQRWLRIANISGFSGGLNLRDAPSEVADDEATDCMNITLDEKGGVVKRLGLTKLNASQVNTTAFDNIFYSRALQITLAQQGQKLFRSTDGGASWTELQTSAAATPALPSSSLVGFADYIGKIAIGTSAGLYSYDNTTLKLSALVASSPPSTMLAVYQNRLFSAGDPANKTRVTNSDPGAYAYTTAGTTYNTNDFRTKDDQPITALGGGEGVDFSGHSGLLVWKEESFYRLNNALTIAYDPISIEYGCSGPLALASIGGVTAAISKKGIVTSSDTDSNLVSDKVSPLFTPDSLSYSRLAQMCAGVYRNKIIFSLSRAGAASNNLTLEYSPSQGWIVPHDFGVSCMTTYGLNNDFLVGGAKASGYAYKVFAGGSDDGVAIASRYQTRWLPLNGHNQFRLRRLRLSGRGAFNFYVKYDFTTGAGSLNSVDLSSTAAIYGTAVYNNPAALYGPANYEAYEDFYSLGVGKTVAFNVTQSSTTSKNAQALLGDGNSPEVGDFSILGIQCEFVPLGAS